MFRYTLREQKDFSKSLSSSNYQCPQCSSTCHLRNIHLGEQTHSFFLKFGHGFDFLEETKESIQDLIGDVHCPTCPNEKCVNFSTNKTCSFFDCIKCKAHSQVPNVPFIDKVCCLVVMVHNSLQKTSCDIEKGKPVPNLKKFIRQSLSSRPELELKK